MSVPERLRLFLQAHHSPREIALGVAIGVFIGIIPLYGLHTLMVIAAAFWVKRANKISMFLGTSISIPPTLPLITWTGYEWGRSILGDRHPPLRWEMFQEMFHQSWGEIYRTLLGLYAPLFVGSLVLGLVLAAFFYFLTLGLVSLWQKKSVVHVGRSIFF